MQYQNYFEFMDKQGGSTGTCQYCESPISIGKAKEAICSFCEGYFSYGKSIAADPNSGRLSDIQLMVDQSRVEEARKSLDALISAGSNLNLLFAAGSIYKTLSDIKHYDLNYGRKGFMEENSANVYYSLDLTSKYKEVFYKVIRMVSDQTKDAPNDELLYLSFISYVKLKRINDAERILSSMPGSNVMLREYADMVFSVESNGKEGYQKALKLAKEGNTNAIYYLARYYAGKKQLSEAKAILERLNSSIRMPDAIFLLKRVNGILEETKI
jgi:hypothetical protein